MDINITAIERLIRHLSVPVGMIALGIFLAVTFGQEETPGGSPVSVMLGGFWYALRWPAMGLVIFGASFGLWRLWQLYRWESGEVDGGCLNCGGPMSHKDGRYGPYSICRMCGSKREGWH